MPVGCMTDCQEKHRWHEGVFANARSRMGVCATTWSSTGELGVPIKVVSESMGHADVATTLRTYTHVLSAQRAELAHKFRAAVWPDLSWAGSRAARTRPCRSTYADR